MGSGDSNIRGGPPGYGGRTSQELRKEYDDKARKNRNSYTGGPPAPQINSKHSITSSQDHKGQRNGAPIGSAYNGDGGPHSQAVGPGYADTAAPHRGPQASFPPSGRLGQDGESGAGVAGAMIEFEKHLAGANRLAQKLVAIARAEARDAGAAVWATEERKLTTMISELIARLNDSHEHAQKLEDQLTDLTQARSERGSTAFSLQGFVPDELTIAAGRTHQAIAHFAEELDRALAVNFGGIPLLARSSVPAADNRHVLTGIATSALFVDFETESFEREGVSCLPENEETKLADAGEREKLRRWEDPETFMGKLQRTPFGAYCAIRGDMFLETVRQMLPKELKNGFDAVFADRRVRTPWEVAAAEAWRLHRMAHFCSPPPRIIRRTKGMPVDEFCDPGPDLRPSPTVLFMLMPGFKVGGVLVSKCHVYPVPPGAQSEADRIPRSGLEPAEQADALTPELAQLQGDPGLALSTMLSGPSQKPPYEAP